MEKITILVIDDEFNMRNLLRIYLVKNGFDVTEARNGSQALQLLEKRPFDVVILDIMMPDMDGWDLCSRIRETMQIPIIMLTARTETKDKIRGLHLGADDYLTKPFEPEELIARIHALLRRANFTDIETDWEQIELPDLLIDVTGRQVRIANQVVDFTPKEFDLLYLLASSPHRVYNRELLLEQVWGGNYFVDIRQKYT